MNFIVEDENGREVTVWTSDNFTPGNYLPLSGGTLSGILKIKSKLFISELPGFQDVNPSISLAIGDSDTGFHSIGDGEVVYYSNNRALYNMKNVYHTGNFNPADKLNVTGGTINGNLAVTGSFSAASISCSGRLSTSTISIGGHNFDPNTKSNTNHTHDYDFISNIRYTAMVLRHQGERNDRISVEFGSGILVTAATYGEGPNICSQNTRQLQILKNGSWYTIGY